MKVCKVITTVFLGRKIREDTTRCGVPRGLFNHSQNFPTPQSVIELLKLTIILEEKSYSGTETDIVIVNNDVDFKEGNEFLKSIDGKKISNGIIRVFFRENFGRSFGGYNYAFNILKNEYDYFIFTEDDIIIHRTNYAIRAIELFNSEKNIGAVAYQSTSIQHYNKVASQEHIHIHGGVCLSSTKVLKKVCGKLGSLPHCKQGDSQSYEDIIVNGEIAFTNEIYKLGYDLVNVDEKFYDYAYDYMRNIIL